MQPIKDLSIRFTSQPAFGRTARTIGHEKASAPVATALDEPTSPAAKHIERATPSSDLSMHRHARLHETAALEGRGALAGGFHELGDWVAAVEAQLALARAIDALRVAQQSEVSIRQRTEFDGRHADLEVESALPADARLAVAQARRAESERQLNAAVSRCEAVFGARCGSLEQLISMGTPMLLQMPRDEPGG